MEEEKWVQGLQLQAMAMTNDHYSHILSGPNQVLYKGMQSNRQEAAKARSETTEALAGTGAILADIDSPRPLPISMAEADPDQPIPPSMVDGLKPGQRKVLSCAFKTNYLVRETRLAAGFMDYVSEHAEYRHGEVGLASAIVGMVQDFLGGNNISLLEPHNGYHGTRYKGGQDAVNDMCLESIHCLYTRLAPITRLIFPKDDNVLLNYLNEDGKSIEPIWYMPIIPMVLVNGTCIGTGSSSYVPNYNPRDIISNLKRLLNGETVIPMDPWYKGFKGSFKKISLKAVGVTNTSTGVIEQVDDTKLRITELPVGCWTQDYRDFLDSMCPHNKDKEPPFLERYRSMWDHALVDFEIILSEQNMNIAKQEGLEKKFNLTTTIGTTNMHLFDSDGNIRKYDTPEDILQEFFKLRLEFYRRRKAVKLESIEKELLKPKNKVRFILAINSGDIVFNNRKRAEICLELKQKGYEPCPKKKIMAIPKKKIKAKKPFPRKKITAKEVDEGNDYEYLLETAISTLTLEKVEALIARQKKLEDGLESWGKATPEILWLRDLNALEMELDALDAKYVAKQKEIRRWQAEQERWWENMFKDEKASKAAPKRQPKRTASKSQKANLARSSDEDSKPKPPTQKKKPPKKASGPVKDEEDEALDLKDRLSVYNFDFPPEDSATETKSIEGQKNGKNGRNEPGQRGAAKKAMAPLTELSDTDIAVPIHESEDNKFTVEKVQVEKKTGGRKPAAEKPKETAIRKRVPAQSKSGAPPEKKTRKMRASHYKENASIPQGVASTSTTTEDVAPRRSARLTQSTSIVDNI